MAKREQGRAARQGGEAGFMLITVVVMVALILIALSVAAPIIAKDLRRDKEVESEHRAQQYVRAIQLFYRKNNSYPPSIKALESTNNVRYLRKQWVDPLTGQPDWRIIHQGEQKTTIKGFFGKELAGLPGAGGGLGSAGGMQSGGGAAAGSTTINSGGLAGGFNGATVATPGSPGSPGSSGATGSTGSSGTGMFGDSGGGGPIVGVGTAKSGESILTPNGQTTYETWEFWYDPRIEAMKKGVSILGGGIASQTPSTFGTPIGSPGATGSTGLGAPTAPSNGPGVSGMQTTTP